MYNNTGNTLVGILMLILGICIGYIIAIKTVCKQQTDKLNELYTPQGSDTTTNNNDGTTVFNNGSTTMPARGILQIGDGLKVVDPEDENELYAGGNTNCKEYEVVSVTVRDPNGELRKMDSTNEICMEGAAIKKEQVMKIVISIVDIVVTVCIGLEPITNVAVVMLEVQETVINGVVVNTCRAEIFDSIIGSKGRRGSSMGFMKSLMDVIYANKDKPPSKFTQAIVEFFKKYFGISNPMKLAMKLKDIAVLAKELIKDINIKSTGNAETDKDKKSKYIMGKILGKVMKVIIVSYKDKLNELATWFSQATGEEVDALYLISDTIVDIVDLLTKIGSSIAGQISKLSKSGKAQNVADALNEAKLNPDAIKWEIVLRSLIPMLLQFCANASGAIASIANDIEGVIVKYIASTLSGEDSDNDLLNLGSKFNELRDVFKEAFNANQSN